MSFNKLFSALYLLVVLTLFSCDKENRCIRSSGEIQHKTVELASFSGVDLRLPGDVEIIKSGISKVEIQARENIIDLIRTDIISGTLRLDTDNRCFRGRTDLHFKVYTPDLGYLRVAGSGNIYSSEEFPQRVWRIYIDGSGDINAKINGTQTEAIISGSGGMHLSGSTNHLAARISGSGNMHGFDVTSKEMDATISGSGNIEATVTEKLSATISGSGNVRYKGQPSVTNVSISGSGRVLKVD